MNTSINNGILIHRVSAWGSMTSLEYPYIVDWSICQSLQGQEGEKVERERRGGFVSHCKDRREKRWKGEEEEDLSVIARTGGRKGGKGKKRRRGWVTTTYL